MKIKINRDDTPIEIKRIKILIGEERFTLTESVDGRLNINKISEGDTDEIQVFSRCSNEIELK